MQASFKTTGNVPVVDYDYLQKPQQLDKWCHSFTQHTVINLKVWTYVYNNINSSHNSSAINVFTMHIVS